MFTRLANFLILLSFLLIASGQSLAADRYWVGGTANWDGVAGVKWATTSGGPGGASVPTAADNAIIDGNSGVGTVTIAAGNTGCLKLDASTFGGTLAGNTAINISDGLELSTTLTRTYTGAITFNSTSGTSIIRMNGKTLASSLTFNGVGGTWQLADGLTTTGAVTLTNGTIDANNQNFSMLTFSSSNANVRTITMGSGTWTLTGNNATIWTTATSTNLTLNRGNPVVSNYAGAVGTRTITGSTTEATSVAINITGGSDIVALSGGWYDVNFTGFSGTLTNTTRTIYGNITFSAAMTETAGANATTFAATSGTKSITSNGETLDFPLTFNGAGGTWQLVDTLTMGSSRLMTLTAGTFDANNNGVSIGSFSSSNANARTITMGSGTWTLKGNNTTIWTTSTSTNLTLNRGNAIVSNYAGAVGTRTVVGSTTENTSVDINFTGGTDIIDLTGGTRSINFTGFAGSLNADNRTIYGSLTLSAGMTWSAGSTTTFAGTSGPYTITSSGKTIDSGVTFNSTTGTWLLSDTFTVGSSRTVTVSSGTFDANNQTVTVGRFSSSTAVARTITMGNGQWTLTGNNATIWNLITTTNLTLNIGSNPVICNYAGTTGTRRIRGTTEVYAVDFHITAGTDIVRPNTGVRDLIFNAGFTGSLFHEARTIYGSLTISSGMTVLGGTSATTFRATSGTHTITTNGVTIDFPVTLNGIGGTWQLADDLTLGSARTLTVTNGTFDANNRNVSVGLFSSSSANNRTILMGSGTWDLKATTASTIWNTATITNLTLDIGTSNIIASGTTTSTRTLSGGLALLPHVTVSGAGTGAVTTTNINCANLTFPDTFVGTWNSSSITVRGNLYFGATTNIVSGTTTITMAATTGTKSITTNGITIGRNFTFNGVGGTWQTTDHLTLVNTRLLTLTNGTFDANNMNISIGRFNSNNANVRSLTMGSGTWTLSGDNNTIWDTTDTTNLTIASAVAVTASYTGSVGTRTIIGGLSATTSVDFNINSGSDILAISGGVGDLDLTGFSGTLTNQDRSVYGDLDLAAAMTLTAGGSTTTFSSTGAQTITTNAKNINFPIVFNGIGGSWILQDNLDTSSDITISNGTLDANLGGSYSISLEGTWTNAGNFIARTGTVTLDGTHQGVTGSTTFYNLTKLETSDDSSPSYLTFTSAGTTSVINHLNINGLDANDRIRIVTDTSGAQSLIEAQGTHTLNYLNVKDSYNFGSGTLFCPIGCTDSGNNFNWDFTGLPITISGAAYTDKGITNIGAGVTVAVSLDGSAIDSSDVTNGSGQFTINTVGSVGSGKLVTLFLDGNPAKAVTVTSGNGTNITNLDLYQNYLILRNEEGNSITNAQLDTANNSGDTDIDAIYTTTGSQLDMAAGTSLLLFTGNSYIPGDVVNAHHIELEGTLTMSTNQLYIGGNLDTSPGYFDSDGTITFDGTTSLSIETGTSNITNLEFNGVGGNWELQNNIVLDGSLTITTGTLDVKNGSNFSISLDGTWDNSGSFLARNGSVNLTGDSQTILGNTTFYNLTKTELTDDGISSNLIFENGSTTVIQNSMIFNGLDSDDLLRVISDSTGVQWSINPQGARDTRYLYVQDSNNVNATDIPCNFFCTDGGNNIKWDFSPPPITITGTVYSDAGITNIGAGYTVSVSINGSAVDSSDDTNGSGQYSITTSTGVAGGDPLTLFLNDEPVHSVTVTTTAGTNVSNVDLYQNHLVVRDETGILPITNVHLNAANNSGDSDINAIYTTAGDQISMAFGKTLFVRTGNSLNATDTIDTFHVKLDGTMNMSSQALSVSGDLTAFPGRLVSTGTVTLDATGPSLIRTGTSSITNLTFNSPTGSWTLQDNLNVDGNLTITNGSLDVHSTGNYSINVAGNWSNSATFIARSGTVSFDGTAIQTISAGASSFNSITLANTTASTTLASNIDLTGNLTIAALTALDTDIIGNYSISLDGTWSNSGTFQPRNGTVNFTGVNQGIVGSTTFYNLTKLDPQNNASPSYLNFTDGSQTTITNTMSLNGLDGNDLVYLRSTTFGAQWFIDPQGTRNVSFLDVEDSNNNSGTTIDCIFACVDSGNNFDWNFNPNPINITGTVYSDKGITNIGAGIDVSVSVDGGAAEDTGTTDASGAFSLSTTSPVGLNTILTLYLDDVAPQAVTVAVSDGTSLSGINLYQNYLILRNQTGDSITNSTLATAANNGDADISAIYTMTGTDLSVAAGKNLYVPANHTFTPGDTVTAVNIDTEGTINMEANNLTLSGSFDATTGVYQSTGITQFSAAAPQTITSGSNSFYDVQFTGGAGSWVLQDNLTITGDMTIQSGTLDANNTGNYSITISGDWTNSGTFTARNGTVTLNGVDQTIGGNTTFYNLTKTETTDDATDSQLTFHFGGTQVVSNVWTCTGLDADDMINIRSTTPGSQAQIDPQGTRSVSYLDVQDSNNINASNIICSTGCVDSFNNTNWSFSAWKLIMID